MATKVDAKKKAPVEEKKEVAGGGLMDDLKKIAQINLQKDQKH